MRTSGKLDNGRGLARAAVFRHRHELESGRTSSITQHIMGLSADGRVVNYSNVHQLTSTEIVRDSSKVVTFIDLAGHEKYIKTTVYGMTGCVPDYTMVVVGANMGVQRMTREHLGVALALKCPTLFVVSKVDMCPEHVLKATVDEVCKIIKAPGIRKIPLIVRSEQVHTRTDQLTHAHAHTRTLSHTLSHKHSDKRARAHTHRLSPSHKHTDAFTRRTS